MSLESAKSGTILNLPSGNTEYRNPSSHPAVGTLNTEILPVTQLHYYSINNKKSILFVKS